MYTTAAYFALNINKIRGGEREKNGSEKQNALAPGALSKSVSKGAEKKSRKQPRFQNQRVSRALQLA